MAVPSTTLSFVALQIVLPHLASQIRETEVQKERSIMGHTVNWSVLLPLQVMDGLRWLAQ